MQLHADDWGKLPAVLTSISNPEVPDTAKTLQQPGGHVSTNQMVLCVAKLGPGVLVRIRAEESADSISKVSPTLIELMFRIPRPGFLQWDTDGPVIEKQ